MSKLNNGGPAFPIPGYGKDGMSLRDYFAAKALAAIIQTWPSVEEAANVHDEDSLLKVTASDAYRFADAMLAAREERKR